MPSPFPGMDPFIESQRWEGFHASIIPTIAEILLPELRPDYFCDVQNHVYLMTNEDEIRRHLGPDVHVAARDLSSSADLTDSVSAGQVATLLPKVITLPSPFQLEQGYLVIRTTKGREVVTVIEVLSPWNKSRPEGLPEYLTKRQEYFHSSAHVVEIDLLRGGNRLPCQEALPDADYFTYVSRSYQRPSVDVYSWSLRDPLPTVPTPLREGDADIPLDLAETFERVYSRGGYDYSIDYGDAVVPRASGDDSAWIAERITQWQTRQGC